jgi:uncharacterized SAM-binding protein YcdF (DUF218 family)
MSEGTNTPRDAGATVKLATSWWVGIIIVGVLGAFIYWVLGPFADSSRRFSAPTGSLSSSKADCAVVLTGGAGRVREAIALLSLGQIRKLIVSGVHARGTLADIFPEILYYPEVSLDSVILERRSGTTASNAQQSLIVSEALKCESVLLMTSDYHMYRAFETFVRVFPPTVPLIPYAVASDRGRQKQLFDFKYFGGLFEEAIKYLFYLAFVF